MKEMKFQKEKIIIPYAIIFGGYEIVPMLCTEGFAISKEYNIFFYYRCSVGHRLAIVVIELDTWNLHIHYRIKSLFATLFIYIAN